MSATERGWEQLIEDQFNLGQPFEFSAKGKELKRLRKSCVNELGASHWISIVLSLSSLLEAHTTLRRGVRFGWGYSGSRGATRGEGV